MPRVPRVAIMLDPSRSFDRGLLRGIAHYVDAHRPWEVVRPVAFYQRFSGLADQTLAEIRRSRPDGILANGARALRRISSLHIPLIIVPVDREFSGAVHLRCDNRAVGVLAADHLRGVGLRSFAFAGFDEATWSLERQQAFCERLAEFGHVADSRLVPLRLPRRQQTPHQKQFSQWLAALPRPVGIMACNDEFARSIAELCRVRGIRLPEEVALIGVDNDELVCELTNPPLSSVTFATEHAGYEAAEILDRWMSKGKVAAAGIRVTAGRVVVRGSTDVLAIDDEEIVKALRFIRENSHRSLSVGEVVEATLLSQWTLNRRFRDLVGHPILKEIHRQRAAQIAELLAESRFSIDKIAETMECESPAHFARFFAREFGVTPRAYRHKHQQR